MKPILFGTLATALLLTLTATARAQTAQAVLDKAIKAAGGEEKLSKLPAITWKTKGTISFGGNESDFNTQVTTQDLDHYRSELTGDFGGNDFRAVTVIAGDKAWRKINDMQLPVDEARLAVEKRNAYLLIGPALLVPLKSAKFKAEVAGDENVAGKPATALKFKGPEGKEFKLWFDKESGLPVKLLAEVLGQGPMPMEYTQETTYSAYKDFDGVKKATKVVVTRNGEEFQKYEVVEFKVLNPVPRDTFTEPN